MFMMHINTHLNVLRVFGRALKDVIEKATWDLYFNTADGLFDNHRNRLALILKPQHRQTGGLVVPELLIMPVRLTIWTPGGPQRRKSHPNMESGSGKREEGRT
jgi:hypothetical protein